MVTSTLSDWLGWLSIGAWLGAQFPQVIENYKRQSVEGLALPFLANWLFGDITNLVGCILTHQLPFQTYLATYFVFVDFSLFGQYLYYASLRPHPKSSRRASQSHEREASHYRTLSVVASHVAASAALAAQAEAARARRASAAPGSSAERDTDPEPDDAALAALADSFMSDASGRVSRKRVSWSRERGRGPASPTEARDFAFEAGPSRGRVAQLAEGEIADAAQRRSSRASRRGATLVFLGVWTLFAVGTVPGIRRGGTRRSLTNESSVGRIVADVSSISSSNNDVRPVAAQSYLVQSQPSQSETIMIPIPTASTQPFVATERSPSAERVIGRVSAWICTTLYLTSRLPQIWKNFARKSVEGLSIALFVFAFLGNSFYVGSILTSPPMSGPPEEAMAFVKESLPYLLGSGGTLMFDITIVMQSMVYRRPHRQRGRGRASMSRTAPQEEQAGLLDTEQGTDGQAEHGS